MYFNALENFDKMDRRWLDKQKKATETVVAQAELLGEWESRGRIP